MRWVLISEGLPQRKAEYFVVIDDYKSVAIFDGINFFSNDDVVTKSITKWLDEGQSDSDAVAFKDWCKENTQLGNFYNGKLMTSEQLYDIFKNKP